MHQARSALAPHPPGTSPPGGWALERTTALLTLLFVLLHMLLQWPALDPPLLALNAATADGAIAWLAAAGVPLLRQGTLVMHAQGFVTEVHQSCTALLPALLLAVGIGLHPRGRPAQKLAGMLLGAAVVVLVNQCRLAGVIWVGVHAPQWFALVHEWLAPAGLVGLTTAYGLAWAWAVDAAAPPRAGPIQR